MKNTVTLQRYKAINGHTGVKAYAIGEDNIRVQFQDGRTYLYDFAIPGKRKVEKMKQLAISGKGLTTFINQHVREQYAVQLA